MNKRGAIIRGFGSPAGAVHASAGSRAPMKLEQIEASAGVGRMVISGLIEKAQPVTEMFDMLADMYGAVEVVFQNCPGGSVPEGLVIFNHIKASSVKKEALVRGYTASMGAFLLFAFDAVRVEPFSRVMFHAAGGKVEGNAKDLREAADHIASYDDDLATIMAEGMGKPKEEIITTYFDYKDHWLTADEVVALGIATKAEARLLKSDPVTAQMKSSHDIMGLYELRVAAALNTDNQPTIMKKVAFIAALSAANKNLSLTAEASEDAILAEVTAQSNALVAANARVAELEAAEKTAQLARAAELVDNAITANKIDKGQREQFLSLAKVDYANTSAVLAKMSAHTPIHGSLNKEGKPAGEEFKGKSFKEISAAKGGEQYLASLKKTNEELFNRMKAAYNEVVD